MSKTSTGERFNPLAVASPPNPPPTITTRGAFVAIYFTLNSSILRQYFAFGMRRVHADENCHSFASRFAKTGVRIFQPESNNLFAPKQSHVPVIRHLPPRSYAVSLELNRGGRFSKKAVSASRASAERTLSLNSVISSWVACATWGRT